MDVISCGWIIVNGCFGFYFCLDSFGGVVLVICGSIDIDYLVILGVDCKLDVEKFLMCMYYYWDYIVGLVFFNVLDGL